MKNKICLKLKWWWVDFIALFGWKPDLSVRNENVRVLVFHGVCKDDEPYINHRFIRLKRLEQLLIECKNHFHPINIVDFKENRLSNSKLNILFTFDDGYKNNLDLAIPLFAKYDIPITIFCNAVSAHLMDLLDISLKWQPELINRFRVHFDISQAPKNIKDVCKLQNADTFNKMRKYLSKNLNEELKENTKLYWELLSDKDLQVLSNNSLVHFGNHGAEHLFYPKLSQDEIEKDISMVIKRFQNLEIELHAFAYPFGAYHAQNIATIKNIGYNFQFLDDKPIEPNQFVFARLTINPYISTINQIIAILNGYY